MPGIRRSEVSAGDDRNPLQDVDAVRVGSGGHGAGAVNQCLIGRNRAAYAGQRCLLIGIRPADDGVNLEARCGLDERLDAVEVRDAGQFDKNLVVTKAILLNDGLADAKGVDAVANHFNRVLDGPLVERLLDVRLHCDVQRVIAPAADVILARVLAVDEGLYRAGLRRVNSFDLNLLRVGRIRLG